MKKTYNIILLIIGLILIWFIYPVGLNVPISNPIDCNEWYKNHTGVCDDFSDPLINILILIIPLALIIPLVLILIFKPIKKQI